MRFFRALKTHSKFAYCTTTFGAASKNVRSNAYKCASALGFTDFDIYVADKCISRPDHKLLIVAKRLDPDWK